MKAGVAVMTQRPVAATVGFSRQMKPPALAGGGFTLHS